LKEEETEEMIKIWIEEVGDAGGSINPKSLISRLNKTLDKAFNGSLEEWRAYCSIPLANENALLIKKLNEKTVAAY